MTRRPIRSDLVSTFLKELSESETHEDLETRGVYRRDLAHTLLRDAYCARASDIHFEPESLGSRLRFRIDGVVYDVAHLKHHEAKSVINQFKAMADLDPVTPFTPRDAHATCLVDESKLDMRLALVPSLGGEALSIRLLNNQRIQRSLDELGLSPETKQNLEEWLDHCSGMFLAAGPTSSGKTTTVYALLHKLRFADRRIISFEDPVEYQVDGITQIQLDERHELNFGEGVRSMLRLDPDYLMLGEIRDGSSAHSAVNAAISGRVLLSTIHSRDAVGTVTALRSWGLPNHEIAESLTIVIAQRLVRKLCPNCRNRAHISEGELSWLNNLHLVVPKKMWQPKGCETCKGLGFFGRTGIFELWRLGDGDNELIQKGGTEQQIRNHLLTRGHITLLGDGLEKVSDGITSLSEIKRLGFGAVPPQRVNSLAVEPISRS